MKKKLCLFILAALVIFQLISCKKCSECDSSTNQQPTTKQGALLFWINNSAMLNTCGVLTVKLSNGQQTNITGYYNVAPSNCVNLVGGYLYLNEGSYTYQVTSSNNCTINGGTITVIGNQCNMAKIQ